MINIHELQRLFEYNVFVANSSRICEVFSLVMVGFMFLCHLTPHWVAKIQSNPYTIQFLWNFGPSSMDFQVLNYEIYHNTVLARWAHHLTVIAEAFLWLLVTRGYFGMSGLLLLLAVLLFQSHSFEDSRFALIINTTYLTFAVGAELVHTFMEESLPIARMLIFYSVVIRTASHTIEQIPPIVNPVDRHKFGMLAYQFALAYPFRAFFTITFGFVSEMASGIPGRLYPVVVFLALTHLGYKSTAFTPLKSSHAIRSDILKKGWSAHPVTAKLYAWTGMNDAKVVEDEKTPKSERKRVRQSNEIVKSVN